MSSMFIATSWTSPNAGMTFCWLEVTFFRPLMTVSVNCSYVIVFSESESAGPYELPDPSGPWQRMQASV